MCLFICLYITVQCVCVYVGGMQTSCCPDVIDCRPPTVWETTDNHEWERYHAHTYWLTKTMAHWLSVDKTQNTCFLKSLQSNVCPYLCHKNLIFLKQVIKSACAVREFPSVWIWLYKIILPLICIGSWLIESHLTGRYFQLMEKTLILMTQLQTKTAAVQQGWRIFWKPLAQSQWEFSIWDYCRTWALWWTKV